MFRFAMIYGSRNLLARSTSSLMTMGGIALVVFTFVAVISLADSIRDGFRSSGSPRNILFLRHGATAETSSIVEPDQLHQVAALSGIARGPDGRTLVAPEIAVPCILPRADGVKVNVSLRGITPLSYQVREGTVRVVGRRPDPGVHAAVVGRMISRMIRSTSVGDVLKVGRLRLQIVGLLDAPGSTVESEIWIDRDLLMLEYRHSRYSSLLARLDPGVSPGEFCRRVSGDPRIALQALVEREYYQNLDDGSREVRWLGLLLTTFMALAAVFGAMNTMYQAVAGRIREIGTLRALGLTRATIMAAVILEATLLSLAGGCLGSLLSLGLDGYAIKALHIRSMVQFGYELHVSVAAVVGGSLLSLALGVLGGFLPAWHGTQVSILEALREV